MGVVIMPPLKWPEDRKPGPKEVPASGNKSLLAVRLPNPNS